MRLNLLGFQNPLELLRELGISVVNDDPGLP